MRVKLIEYVQRDRGFAFSIAVPCQNGKPHSKLVEHGLRKVPEYILPMFRKHPSSYDEILSVFIGSNYKYAHTASAVEQGADAPSISSPPLGILPGYRRPISPQES